MVEERAAAFTKRSIKTSAKLSGLKLAVPMMDLTTLEGKDTPGKVAFLCRKAMQPIDRTLRSVPSCAAVCVYPNLVSRRKNFSAQFRRQSRIRRDRFSHRPDAAATEAGRSAERRPRWRR